MERQGGSEDGHACHLRSRKSARPARVRGCSSSRVARVTSIASTSPLARAAIAARTDSSSSRRAAVLPSSASITHCSLALAKAAASSTVAMPSRCACRRPSAGSPSRTWPPGTLSSSEECRDRLVRVSPARRLSDGSPPACAASESSAVAAGARPRGARSDRLASPTPVEAAGCERAAAAAVPPAPAAALEAPSRALSGFLGSWGTAGGAGVISEVPAGGIVWADEASGRRVSSLSFSSPTPGSPDTC